MCFHHFGNSKQLMEQRIENLATGKFLMYTAAHSSTWAHDSSDSINSHPRVLDFITMALDLYPAVQKSLIINIFWGSAPVTHIACRWCGHRPAVPNHNGGRCPQAAGETNLDSMLLHPPTYIQSSLFQVDPLTEDFLSAMILPANKDQLWSLQFLGNPRRCPKHVIPLNRFSTFWPTWVAESIRQNSSGGG